MGDVEGDASAIEQCLCSSLLEHFGDNINELLHAHIHTSQVTGCLCGSITVDALVDDLVRIVVEYDVSLRENVVEEIRINLHNKLLVFISLY